VGDAVAIGGVANGVVASGVWLSSRTGSSRGVIVGAVVTVGSNEESGTFVAEGGLTDVTVGARASDVSVPRVGAVDAGVVGLASAGSSGSALIVGTGDGEGTAAKREQDSEARHIPRRAMRRRGCFRQSADKSFTTWVI
jgi:hypothetical protein